MTKTLASDPGPIELTPQQQDPYTARPEDFAIRSANDAADVSGQRVNDPEAAKRSSEKMNRGSVRAEGNVNHPAPRPKVHVND